MNELVPLTAQELQAQVNLIQTVMKSVMKEDTHYGTIPGCKKPSLWKAGAEKLSLTFRLRPIIDNDRDVRIIDLGDRHREYTVYCHIMTADGMELATGVGSCSTMESKYRYRGGEKISTGLSVPKEYWNAKKDGDMHKAQELIGGRGFSVAKIDGKWEIVEFGERQENPDIADCYNTVLKMAKKRSQVDGILSATAASDIFTQDIDGADEDDQRPDGAPKKEQVKPPQPKQQPEKQRGDEPPLPSDDDAPGGAQQGELVPPEVPACESCGLPLGKDVSEAQKVIDWCRKKKYGAALCRNCQPKN